MRRVVLLQGVVFVVRIAPGRQNPACCQYGPCGVGMHLKYQSNSSLLPLFIIHVDIYVWRLIKIRRLLDFMAA